MTIKKFVSALIIASATIAPVHSSFAAEPAYTVSNGNELDAHSYKGFKLFRNWCARCHGSYGQGMVGPNLADSLKIISEDEFNHTVTEGKTGSIGSMPAWKSNEKVMANLDALYAYLKARSDGAIGEVKPKQAK
jgi:mono/diheme cytochrome c family protein